MMLTLESRKGDILSPAREILDLHLEQLLSSQPYPLHHRNPAYALNHESPHLVPALPRLSPPPQKTPCADFSGTLLGADAATGLKPDVFGITVNPFAGGTLCEVAHLPVVSTTVVN